VKRDFYSAVDPMAAEAPAKKPGCAFGCFGGYAMNKRNGCGGPKFTHDVFRFGLRNVGLDVAFPETEVGSARQEERDSDAVFIATDRFDVHREAEAARFFHLTLALQRE